MDLFIGSLVILFVAIVWSINAQILGPHWGTVLIAVELIVFAVAMLWSFIVLTGPHTGFGKKRRKRQDNERFDRAVAKDVKDFGGHH